MPFIIMLICFGLFWGFLFIPVILEPFKPKKKGIVITPDDDTQIKIKYIKGNKNE